MINIGVLCLYNFLFVLFLMYIFILRILKFFVLKFVEMWRLIFIILKGKSLKLNVKIVDY